MNGHDARGAHGARGAREAGRIAYAQGEPAPTPGVCPPDEETGWVEARDFHVRGLDRGGHRMNPPHLCSRDATKVCACCTECETICRVQRMFDRARGFIRRLLP